MNEQFKDVKITSGAELAKSPEPSSLSTGMASEQSQAVAKIQAALTIAQARPRNEALAIDKIEKSCGRKSLAEKAEYAYKRGTTLIEGPSIQVAKVIATHWQNMKFGFREIGGGPDYTEVEAYAWDLETNTEASRVFKVYNRRYMGDQKLTKERDLYENMASVAQRRVRACIQQVIPEDVFDAAIAACRATLQKADGRPLDQKVKSMVDAFSKIGVTEAMLEGFLGHALTAAVESQVITLRKVYRSIRDGVAPAGEFFDVPSEADQAKARIEAAEKTKKPRKPRSDKGKKRSAKVDPVSPADYETSDLSPKDRALLEQKKQEAQQKTFDPKEELYAMADQIWGKDALIKLSGLCMEKGLDYEDLTDEQASSMIDVLSELSSE